MRTKGEMNQCTAAKPGGERCEAVCRAGTEFCSFHDPDLAEVMRDSRAAGGRARNKPAAVVDGQCPDMPVGSAADIVALLADTINRVRRGTLDPKIGNVVGYLTSVAIRCLEVGQLEDRLAHLEGVISSTRGDDDSGVFDNRIGIDEANEGDEV
jgi:hypothetical protein